MRNIVVTGGSRGIGLGIAAKLASSGFHVIALSRSGGEALDAAIRQAAAEEAGKISFFAQDLSKIEELADAAREIKKRFGSTYGLVNNAGLGTPGMLGNMKEAEILRLTQLNVTAPLVITKHLMRSMLVAGSGRIVNISSIVALTGYQGISAYSATKAAMLGFTKSLAREVGGLGITVNAVLPGFTDTEMTGEMDAAARSKVANRAALKRLTSISDVANMVDYLMSDHAGGITGSSMVVDAGATA